jgi:hypothetical protein
MEKSSTNTGLIVGLAALVGGAAFFLWGNTGVKIQNLQVAFKSLSSGIKFSFPFLNVPVTVQITNPNKTALTFQEINCDVYINNSKASVLKYSTPIVLKPQANTVLKNILIQTEVFTATDKALDFFSKTVSIQIKGYLRADNFNFPVNETIQIQ